MIARLLTRIAARILSKRAHQSAHNRIITRTVELRSEFGLPNDRRLA